MSSAEAHSESAIDGLYPRAPGGVPDDLARATGAYRARAWLSVVSLGGFLLLYFGGAAFFAWSAVDLVRRGLLAPKDGIWLILAGMVALVAVFMAKGLYFIKRIELAGLTEITAAEQPLLFAFLHRLTEETGAPHPYRVYLSNRVNAAVFYDLTILNLLYPSKKNLEIGLPLINALTLTEFKAVLGHEFGHFSQRSTAIGRWVYLAQQITVQIIFRRDALDAFAVKLSIYPLRVLIGPFVIFQLMAALIGWWLRVTFWSIRTLADALYRAVALLQRALSRQQELQADLVAVSVSGSDALVHALHKLPAAEEAWNRVCGLVNEEIARGKHVPDAYALQMLAVDEMRRVLAQPDYGRTPPLPETDRASHRVFTQQIGRPPELWMTHPSYVDREANCKRRYVAAALDERSAWVLFEAAAELRRHSTLQIAPVPVTAQELSAEEASTRLSSQFARPSLDRRYRGAYVGRAIARRAPNPADLYGAPPAPEQVGTALAAVYPETLEDELQQLRDLVTERDGLVAIRDGRLEPPDGVIRFRDRTLTQDELAPVIDQVNAQLTAAIDAVEAHDRRCRAAVRAAAAVVGGGWDVYLTGLVQVLHYAEHCEAALMEYRLSLTNTMIRETKAGSIKGEGLNRVVTAGSALLSLLTELHRHSDELRLDPGLRIRLGFAEWPLKPTGPGMSQPAAAGFMEWLKAYDAAHARYVALYARLHWSTLDQLLATEATVAECFREGIAAVPAPAPSTTPARYPVHLIAQTSGDPRPRWRRRLSSASVTVRASALVATAVAMVGLLVAVAIGARGGAEGWLAVALSAHPSGERAPRAGVGGPEPLPSGIDHFNCGLALFNGRGVAKDPIEAAVHFRAAAEAGVPQAQFMYGEQLRTGAGIARDPVQAVEWFRKAATLNEVHAQAALGFALQSGQGVPANRAEALAWYQKAATAGHIGAQYNLAVMYFNGQGMPHRDLTQALHWLELAARQKSSIAELALGDLYVRGEGVSHDLVRGVALVRDAADQRLPGAQVTLGDYYAQGLGLTKNPVVAVYWYRRAADLQDPLGQFRLASAYYEGTGVAKDHSEAFRWFLKAARQGNAAAEFNLSVLYRLGDGVGKNEEEAGRWGKRAADQHFKPDLNAAGTGEAKH